MTCGTDIVAQRDADQRITYSLNGAYSFADLTPRLKVWPESGSVNAPSLTVTTVATVLGSVWDESDGSLILTLAKADLAALPEGDLLYDITLTDLQGFENPFCGGYFNLFADGSESSGGCTNRAQFTVGGQCVSVSIQGGALGVAASLLLADLNAAVAAAEEAAAEAEAAVAGKLNTNGSNPAVGLLANIGAVASVDLADDAGAGLVGVIQSGTGAVAETAQTALRRTVYPEQFGAAGDGTTNDSVAINNAIAAAIAQDATLVFQPGKFYSINTGLTASAAVEIVGYGASLVTANNITMLTGTTGLKVSGLRFEGPSSTFAAGMYGVSVRGTVNGAAVAPTYVGDVELVDCSFENISYGAIDLQYAENVTINNPRIKGVGYFGVQTISCRDVTGNGGTFEDFTGETGSGELNAYPVTWTSDNSTDYVRYPSSERCVWYGGVFKNILTWQAMDTHGGIDCGFVGGVTINCRHAVWLTSRPGRGPIRCFATNIQATNDTTPGSTNPNGSEQRDIAFLINGDPSGGKAIGCQITGYASGFGARNSRVGAALVSDATDCNVNLTLENPFTAGLQLDGQVLRLTGSATIKNPRNPGVGAGGATDVPRYVDVLDTSGSTITSSLSLDLVLDNAALDTFVGTQGFVVSSSATGTVFSISSIAVSSSVPLLINSSAPTGCLIGNVSRAFSLSVEGIASVSSVDYVGGRQGKVTTLSINIVNGTSNSYGFTLGATTPLPAHLRPSGLRSIPVAVIDNGTAALGFCEIDAAGLITVLSSLAGGSWTASGNKRLYGVTLSYAS